MKRELIFLIFIVVLAGNCIKAEMQPTDYNQHFLAKELNQVTRMRLSIIGSDIGNLGINSSNNLFLSRINSRSNIPTNFLKMSNNLVGESCISSVNKQPVILKIIWELFVGELFGVLGGYIGGMIGTILAPGESTMYEIAYMFFGGYLGYVLSIPVGVYIAGFDKYENGSFQATLAGSILGALSWIPLLVFDAGYIGRYLLVIGPPVGAVLGFNLSRTPRESSDNALINYHQGKIQCSWSSVNIYYDCYHKPVFNVNLFQVDF